MTRGLHRTFGAARVFDTLLDEQSILGLALGTGLAGFLPIPEIQYLACLHNAKDQLRGEAATMQFLSQGAYRNPLVVRVAGLAYQKGFGGHFHNDNSLAVLRDIPGLVVAVPAHPRDAAPMLRTCLAAARTDGSVSVLVEPIALYHARDLHHEATRAGSGPMRHRIAGARSTSRISCTRPVSGRVLVVDETRCSGGVSEAVFAALVDGVFPGAINRVCSADSFVPLGPAAAHVLLGEAEIEAAARRLLG